MTREQFLNWAETQPARYEFDGVVPVAVTGGTRNHSLICQNIYAALRSRLKGSGCTVLGPDAGVATVGDAVRYPDALVTCTAGLGTDRLINGVVVVFEVLSTSSGRIDRVEKLREYQAVPTIRRYVIVELSFVGVTVYARADAQDAWTVAAATDTEFLHLAEIGISVPVAEFYEDTGLVGISIAE